MTTNGETLIVDISGNGNFTSIQAAIDAANPGDTIYVWDGEYFENLTIDKTITLIGNGSSTTTINGGYVGDVIRINTDWVNVSGFHIINSGRQLYDAGLEVITGDNAWVYNNSFDSNLYNLRLIGADNSLIDNNYFTNSIYESIDVSSDDCIIRNNEFIDTCVGVTSWYSEGIHVINNNVSGCNDGIWIHGTTNAYLYGNILRDNEIGVMMWDCTNSRLQENEMENCSLHIFGNDLEGWNTHDIDDSNSVNGKPVHYWKNRNGGTVPEGAGQVILAHCTGVTVQDQVMENGTLGIALGHSNGCHIKGNHIMNGTRDDSFGSIWLWESSDNVLEQNILVNNTVAMHLESYSDGNTIIDNDISNNDDGLIIDRSDSTEVTGNTIAENSISDVQIKWSDKTKFHENTVDSNIDDGMKIYRSNLSLIYHNNFLTTGVSVDNMDETTYWHNDFEGNYWDGYAGVDNGDNERVKGDHIGDDKPIYKGLYAYTYVKPWGWRYPYTPLLSAPEWVSDDQYNVSWTQTNKSLEFILEEDVTPAFEDPTILFKGWEEFSQITCHVKDRSPGTYHYRVKGSNAEFDGNWSETVNVTVYADPQIPGNLAVSPVPEGNALTLTWDLNDDDTEGYELQFLSNDPWESLAIIEHPSRTYEHSGLTDGETYQYRLRAVDSRDVHSSFTPIVEGTPADSMPPSPPTNVFTSKENRTGITVSWDASPEDDVEGYHVYRSTSPTGPFGRVNNDSVNGVRFVDIGLHDDTTYHYYVTAVDEVPLESIASDMASGKTLRGRQVIINGTPLEKLEMMEDTPDASSVNLYAWFAHTKGKALEFDHSGDEHLTISISVENGSVLVVPEENWNGEEAITFTASDGVFDVRWNINVTVSGVNDPPVITAIEKPRHLSEYRTDDEITFAGETDDPDLPYGDRLKYKWSSNISGVLGTDETLERLKLPAGSHNVTFLVTDWYGLEAKASLMVIVTEEEEQPPPDGEDGGADGGDGDDGGGSGDGAEGMNTAILVLAVILALCLTVFLLFILRRKRDEDSMQAAKQRGEESPVSPEGTLAPTFEEKKERLRKWTPKLTITSRSEALGILDLEGEPDADAVRERYRELAKGHHPDKLSHLEAEKRSEEERRMMRINEAYHFLLRDEEPPAAAVEKSVKVSVLPRHENQ